MATEAVLRRAAIHRRAGLPAKTIVRQAAVLRTIHRRPALPTKTTLRRATILKTIHRRNALPTEAVRGTTIAATAGRRTTLLNEPIFRGPTIAATRRRATLPAGAIFRRATIRPTMPALNGLRGAAARRAVGLPGRAWTGARARRSRLVLLHSVHLRDLVGRLVTWRFARPLFLAGPAERPLLRGEPAVGAVSARTRPVPGRPIHHVPSP